MNWFFLLIVAGVAAHQSVYSDDDHTGCLVTNWTEYDSLIRHSNQLGSFIGGNGIMQWIKSVVDPIALPAPMKFEIRQKFFGTLHQINYGVDLLRLHGISSATLIPLKSVSATAVETGINIKSLFFELKLDLQFGRATRRRFGMYYCPGVVQFWRPCPVNNGILKVVLKIKDADIKFFADLYVYDCSRTKGFFKKAACKIKSSWGYVQKIFKDGFSSVGEEFLSRFHDARVRYATVAFRNFDMDIFIESDYSLLLDPEIFGFLHTELNAEFRDGLFHDSIRSAIAHAARDALNGIIDGVRPLFNAKHIR